MKRPSASVRERMMPRPCRRSSRIAAEDSLCNSVDFAALVSPLSKPCARTGAIDKWNFGSAVEGEDGQVNFVYDGAQNSGGFARAQALPPRRMAARIRFNHD